MKDQRYSRVIHWLMKEQIHETSYDIFLDESVPALDMLVHQHVMERPLCIGVMQRLYAGSAVWECSRCRLGCYHPALEQHFSEVVPPYSVSWDAVFPAMQCFVGLYSAVYPKRNEVWDRFGEANFAGYGEMSNLYLWITSWTPERLCRAMLMALEIAIPEEE